MAVHLCASHLEIEIYEMWTLVTRYKPAVRFSN
jgi:hypothetical protein